MAKEKFKVGISRDVLSPSGEPVFGREALKVLDDPNVEWEYLPETVPVLTPENASRYDAICLFASRASRETVSGPESAAQADRALRRRLRQRRRAGAHRAGHSPDHRAGRGAPSGGEQRDGLHAAHGPSHRRQGSPGARRALEGEGRLSRLRPDRQEAGRHRRGQHRQGSVPARQALGHGASGLRSECAAGSGHQPRCEDGGPGHAAAEKRT